MSFKMPSVQLTRDQIITFDESFSVIFPSIYTINIDTLSDFLTNYSKGVLNDVWLNPYFKVSIVGKEFQLHAYQIYPCTYILSELSNDTYFIPFCMEEKIVIDTLSLLYHMLTAV